MKKMSTLTNWEIMKESGEWYVLRGSVMNDNRWPDGTVVRTSMLEKVDFLKSIAETRNTIYKLV